MVELSIAAHENFAEFKEQHKRKQNLGDFAGKYLDAIHDNSDFDSKFRHLRN